MKFQSKELKEIIKHYVRESLVEILAEQNIKSIVKEALQDVTIAKPIRNSVTEDTTRRTVDQGKNKILEKLRLPEEAWSSVYADTAKSNNSVLASNHNQSPQNSQPSPELVSENTLEAMGLMNRDFSKHIGQSSDEGSQDSGEYAELIKARQRMLNKSIVKG